MKNKEFIKSITLDGEEWRNVVGYEGLYMVSSFGRIMSLTKEVSSRYGTRTITCKLLSPSNSTDGYCKVILCLNANNRKHVKVHRLVAEAFIPNPKNKPQIDHIDRNRKNNNVNNLRWCTHLENMRNPKTIEHCRKLNLGRVYPTLRKPVVSIKNGIVVKQYGSIQEAVNDGFTRCGVSNCCAGRNPTHYGYKWMYLSDYEKSLAKSVSQRTLFEA